MNDHTLYQSPFTWRYASPEMRQIWSERNKRLLWRQIWIALARAEQHYGLVSAEQVAELAAHAGEIDLVRSFEIEAEIHHDLMAELKTFAEQCPTAGGALHMGATSMDIEDNAEVLRQRQALDLLFERLDSVLHELAQRIAQTADLPVMAFTHLQPAEPTTLGYRLAGAGQDLLADRQVFSVLRIGLGGKGFKGAVGNAAAYGDLLGVENLDEFEQSLSAALDLPFYRISTQTYPRKQDYTLLSALAGLGSSLYKLAFDLRLLQSPPIGELSEPFGKQQVGSSAMPFKRNPVNAEKIDSLARQLSVLPQVAWANASHSLLERTLDDSANRRSILPEAFLICDELLITTRRIIAGLVINKDAIHRNLETYAPFAATERILSATAKQGADRQAIHDRLRQYALAAWEKVQAGHSNPLITLLKSDPEITTYLPVEKIDELLEVTAYTGFASQRALELVDKINQIVKVEA